VRNRRNRPGSRGSSGDNRGNRQDHGNRRDRDRGRGGWSRGRDRGPRPERQETADYWSRLLAQGGENEFLEKTPCPACGNLPARIKGRLGPTLLRKCRSCSLIYISPRLATSVRQDMMRREPSPISSERNLLLRHTMADRMERMHREMPKLEGMDKRAATLLEIGCRWGHFLQLCRPHYRSVEGLEWSKERAAFARERFDLDVSATDIFQDPWEGRYHIIAAWDVIGREPHPQEFLRWTQEHLLPGGLLVLSTPNYNSLFRRLLRGRWYHFEPSRHLCYFTPATLKAQLEKAGFRDVKIRTSGLSPFREWFNAHNRVDRSQDPREQWLENIRGREAIEAGRREPVVGRETAWKKFRKRAGAWLSGIVTAPGLGDEMRVYARKP
jgi:2-polyprenyl-3-methyl-5-hydroxy-6-metoxy-1,4-benzoquinol methylase